MNLERLFSVFRISGSGLTAQRKLMDATASNIANVETTEAKGGRPYTPRRVQFESVTPRESFNSMVESAMWRNRLPNGGDSGVTGSQVKAKEILDNQDPAKTVYEPDNPNANKDGYVEKPNINLVNEMANLMMASRLYEANVTSLNASKSMIKKALEI
jgi:flagellar basal-body rod protein FlgC